MIAVNSGYNHKVWKFKFEEVVMKNIKIYYHPVIIIAIKVFIYKISI